MDDEQPGGEPDARFTLANERTFLAWSRTALALIAGGLAAGQLLDFRSDALRLAAALPPVVIGALLAAVSYRRWERIQLALQRGEPLPRGPLRELAISVVAMGVLVAVIVVVDAIGD